MSDPTFSDFDFKKMKWLGAGLPLKWLIWGLESCLLEKFQFWSKFWSNLTIEESGRDQGDLIISRTRSIIVRVLNDHKNVYGHSEYKNITVM